MVKYLASVWTSDSMVFLRLQRGYRTKFPSFSLPRLCGRAYWWGALLAQGGAIHHHWDYVTCCGIAQHRATERRWKGWGRCLCRGGMWQACARWTRIVSGSSSGSWTTRDRVRQGVRIQSLKRECTKQWAQSVRTKEWQGCGATGVPVAWLDS